MANVKFQINFQIYKLSEPVGDFVESSDDLDGMPGVHTAEESDDSNESDVDDDDIKAEDIADVGEDAGNPNRQENPFFVGSGDDSDVSDT